MVTGFTTFREWFQGFEDQYVVIGGTACDLLMEEEELTFRATKDIDIVLIVEAMTKEFGQRFWEYIKHVVSVLPYTEIKRLHSWLEESSQFFCPKESL